MMAHRFRCILKPLVHLPSPSGECRTIDFQLKGW